MQRVAPLAPMLLAAALIGSFGAPVDRRDGSGPPRASPSPPTPCDRATGDATKDRGRIDPTGRWIVILRGRRERRRGRDTRAPDSASPSTTRSATSSTGTPPSWTAARSPTLRADPNVEAVVPDDVISLEAQTTPRGVRRVFAPRRTRSAQASTAIDRARWTRTSRSSTPASTRTTPTSTSSAASTARPSNRAAWGDGNGHGTHVAGIVGALDNGIGVVGVAPGVRLWAVRILNSGGSGLVSWYVCGLDWITAQRDPADPSRPLIEAVNMSVAKTGSDDRNCGLTNKDPMHQAICRLVASGVTVVAAAGNNHFNAARLGPGQLQRGDHGLGARGQRRQARRRSAATACYSWGGYDTRRHVRQLLELRRATST